MQFRRVVHEAQSVLLVLALKYVVQHLYGIFAQENTPEEFVMRNLNMLIIAAVMQGAALVLGAIVFALASMSTPGAPQTSQLGSQFHALFARTGHWGRTSRTCLTGARQTPCLARKISLRMREKFSGGSHAKWFSRLVTKAVHRLESEVFGVLL